jgi:hypothetical protein
LRERMEIEDLPEQAQGQARIFKSRGSKSPVDGKRHDRLKPDERRWIRTISKRLGWSFARIGSAIDRDWRVVKKVIESAEPRHLAVPHLVIGPLRNRILTDGIDEAKFATAAVTTNGIEAKGCWGWVKVLPSGPSMPLHWRETPFEEEQTQASRIFIRTESAGELDIAFALPPDRVTGISERRYPCKEVPVFLQRMTQLRPQWRGEGCWLARPSAMENPDPRLEAFLSPGQYRIEVTTGCENGKGDSRKFTLESPSSWRELVVVDEKVADSTGQG